MAFSKEGLSQKLEWEIDDDNIFGFGVNFGGGKAKNIKNNLIINETETITINSNGNKKTVIKEENRDVKVKENLLGGDGHKVENKRKIIGYEEKMEMMIVKNIIIVIIIHGNKGKKKLLKSMFSKEKILDFYLIL